MIQLTNTQITDFLGKPCAALGQNTQAIEGFFPVSVSHIIHSKTDSVIEITSGYFTLSCLMDGEDFVRLPIFLLIRRMKLKLCGRF